MALGRAYTSVFLSHCACVITRNNQETHGPKSAKIVLKYYEINILNFYALYVYVSS